jgi:hypothetical protein
MEKCYEVVIQLIKSKPVTNHISKDNRIKTNKKRALCDKKDGEWSHSIRFKYFLGYPDSKATPGNLITFPLTKISYKAKKA